MKCTVYYLGKVSRKLPYLPLSYLPLSYLLLAYLFVVIQYETYCTLLKDTLLQVLVSNYANRPKRTLVNLFVA